MGYMAKYLHIPTPERMIVMTVKGGEIRGKIGFLNLLPYKFQIE